MQNKLYSPIHSNIKFPLEIVINLISLMLLRFKASTNNNENNNNHNNDTQSDHKKEKCLYKLHTELLITLKNNDFKHQILKGISKLLSLLLSMMSTLCRYSRPLVTSYAVTNKPLSSKLNVLSARTACSLLLLWQVLYVRLALSDTLSEQIFRWKLQN